MLLLPTFILVGYAFRSLDFIGLLTVNAGELAWHVTVLGYVVHGVDRNYEATRKSGPVVSIVENVVALYGGGMIVPLLCGKSQIYLVEETYLWYALFGWWAWHYCPEIKGYSPRTLYKDAPLAQKVSGLFFMVWRCHMISNFVGMANTAFSAKTAGTTRNMVPFMADTITLPFLDSKIPFLSSKTPFFGPIICGAIGGTGGLFMRRVVDGTGSLKHFSSALYDIKIAAVAASVIHLSNSNLLSDVPQLDSYVTFPLVDKNFGKAFASLFLVAFEWFPKSKDGSDMALLENLGCSFAVLMSVLYAPSLQRYLGLAA